MELEMDLLPSRIFFQKGSNYKCQFCTKTCAPSNLVSQVSGISEKKHKDEVPDILGWNQNIERSCKPRFWSTELNDMCFKSTEKLVKDECM